MKYCRLTVRKVKEGDRTKFFYPENIRVQDHEIVLYEDPFIGGTRPSLTESFESAITMVPDDYDFPDGTEELTQAQAESIIEDWIDNDQSILGVLDASQKDNSKRARKGRVNELAVIAFTKQDANSKPRKGPPKRTFDASGR